MFKRIAAFFNHPYMGPITETVKGIVAIARVPINGFIEDAVEGWQDAARDREGSSRLRGMYGGIFNPGGGNLGLIGFMGAIFGGIGLAAAGAIVANGAGVTAMIATGIAGLGFGVALGPFALAAGLALAAAAVGTVIGGVPGFIKGVSKIFDYHRDRTGYEMAMQKVRAGAKQDEYARAFAPLLGRFNQLADDKKETFVRMVNVEYQNAVWGEADRIARAVEVMPKSGREKLVQLLKEKLSDEFDDVADLPDVKEKAAPITAPKPDNSPLVAPPIASFRPRRRAVAVP